MVDRMPKGLYTLVEYAKSVPEKRHKFVQGDFCTQINRVKTDLHPVAASRWLDIVKAAPQGMLRHNLREFVPYFDDRLKESMFHKFYESSDVEILKRKGYVFEGRDGEPLKLTLEELRQAREASLYSKDDKATQRNLRYMMNKRMDMRSKDLPTAPTFRPLAYGEGDSLAYIAYRTYPIYAVLLRVYGEIALRCPQFMPRSQLDFGAGVGTAIFTSMEVWKGVGVAQGKTVGEKYRKLKYDNVERLGLQHPRITDSMLKDVLTDVVEREIRSLEKKAVEVGSQVAKGLLPSGSEVEVQDEIAERKQLLNEAVWEGSQKWKGEPVSDGLDEDFLGEGMYAGKTKPFEETDYFLEKDHSEYPNPEEAKQLEERGIRSDIYLKWFNVRDKWAGSYYAHVEKRKMERDPSYRPHSAMQYLMSKSENDQPDKDLPSQQLHEDDIDDKAIVYNDWRKREGEVLRKITAIEPSSAMMGYGMDFLVNVAPHVSWKRFLPDGPSASGTYDLVTCAYTLSELQSESLRADAVRSLWEHCEGVLIIVEAGTPAGFKLVLEARSIILDEYKNIGPWEAQPTVLAPCPHDSRCPVEYSLQGRKFKDLRTCYSVANYEESFVEQWVRGFKGPGQEPYSYCIIARNEIIPKKALRAVPDVKPTVVTENPAKMAGDPRIQKVLRDPVEREKWSSDNRRRVDPDLYEEDEELEYPETEMNMSPLVGRWAGSRKGLSTKDYVALHKEVEEYKQKFRENSWNWSRLVRPIAPNGTVDVCTPHGTQERFRISPTDRSPTLRSIYKKALSGALVPYISGPTRYEWVQGDMPNTFVPPVKTLDPLRTDIDAKLADQLKRIDRAEALEEEPELAAWGQSMENRLNEAKTSTAVADQIREELRDMNIDPRDYR
eukprot:TRINITY_DN21025_c0_g1_i1.p1 TRINITY_DN21025_c0_g1~~TRINITY_DN21025_c0_g1_i1.p1  ORF type:complete len:974 (+),score=267.04 TRINITY_DN21025_c0_g1_i1:258-2924(+)